MTKPREIMKVLKDKGWTFVEGGDHTLAVSPDGKTKVPIPRHNKDIATGTLNSILKATGLK